AVLFRASEDVVAVREVAAAGNEAAAFVERVHEAEAVVDAVQCIDVRGDLRAACVEPWTAADAVASIDGIRALRAEVCTPRAITGACVLRACLADCVSTFEAAEVAAVARA